jgi:hypothetical protein
MARGAGERGVGGMGSGLQAATADRPWRAVDRGSTHSIAPLAGGSARNAITSRSLAIANTLVQYKHSGKQRGGGNHQATCRRGHATTPANLLSPVGPSAPARSPPPACCIDMRYEQVRIEAQTHTVHDGRQGNGNARSEVTECPPPPTCPSGATAQPRTLRVQRRPSRSTRRGQRR